MTLVYILICCIGLTYILKYGSILGWLRNPLCKLTFFRELFKCSLCLGFWSGILLSVALYFIEWNPLFYLLPFASSGVSWISDGVIRLIQTKEMLMDKELEKS